MWRAGAPPLYTDTVYLDSLSDHHLRDLGVRRYTDRSDNFYR